MWDEEKWYIEDEDEDKDENGVEFENLELKLDGVENY